ncbi:MAG: site-specific integrase [Stackebrandtia sp.]
MTKSITKRCGCRTPDTGTRWGAACPRLRRGNGAWHPTHGAWHYQIELPPTLSGARRPLRRSGFASHTAAESERDHIRALLAIPDPGDTYTAAKLGDLIAHAARTKQPIPTTQQARLAVHAPRENLDLPTLADWLAEWLPGRRALKRNTRRSYESHIRLYLTPHLGEIRIDRLKAGHISDMYDAITERNEHIRAARTSDDPAQRAAVKGARTLTATSIHKLHGTLRAALNAAIRAHLITTNPAGHVELPPARRPKPLVWTAERVEHWRRTKNIPGRVMVWTPEQTGAFLDHAAADPLYALYHLVTFRGLRRGEACGLHWTDVDLTAGILTIRLQLLQYGWETDLDTPKTDGSEATVTLDTGTIAALTEHRAAQQHQRAAAGPAWHNTGLVFTRPDGRALHPADVTDRFRELTQQADLPPVRLHDLRHGAASLALAAGADIKTVQALLRHSTITLTADTYTSVLPQLDRTTAEAAAALVPRRDRPPM